MASTLNQIRPETRHDPRVLEQLAGALASSYTPEPGERSPSSPYASLQREAEALTCYWQHLVSEMREVDKRLEELNALLN